MDQVDWIRAGLAKPGKTQSGLAKALGRAPSAVTALLKGERELKAREVAVVAAYLEVLPPGAVPSDEQPGPNALVPEEQPNVDLGDFRGPRNVRVLGTTLGGNEDEGDFRFNGETIEFAPRPPGIPAHREDIYAIYVTGQSMEPKYEEGERVYVDPKRNPVRGDYVVIELHPEVDGEPGQCFIKRLVDRNSERYLVKQFNPEKELTFPRNRVKACHRVIPYAELLGL
jgi:phage repressor protein C with HTH and peptisase S24 domain